MSALKRILAALGLLGGALVAGVSLFVHDFEQAVGTAPPRATGVPPDAVWAGGADGGRWLRCDPIEGAEGRFRCDVFDDASGARLVRGEFVRRAGDEAPVDWKAFESYDGSVIHLPGPRVLVPDGWLEFPGLGRELFDRGRSIREESVREESVREER